MKRLATDWEEIFAKDIPIEGLLYKNILYKEHLEFNNKKTNNSI